MLEPVYAQEVLDARGAVEDLEGAVEKAKKAAPSRSWNAGARKTKQLNEFQQLESAVLEWRGNTMSIGKMHDRRMSTFNTVADSKRKAKARKKEEASGEKVRRGRSGPWGKVEANRIKLFSELDRWVQ